MIVKRARDTEITPLRGWAKFFHRLGRLLLLPLRYPGWTFFILLIMFLAPTFRGIKPVNVPKWYASQIQMGYNRFLVWWGTRPEEVQPGGFMFVPPQTEPQPVTETKPEPKEIQPAEEVQKVMEPQESEAKTEPQQQQTEPAVVEKTETIPVPVKEIKVQLPEDSSLYEYPLDKRVSQLKYVDYPHEIEGKATVYNSNEIEINGEYILMYGIYVHPYTARGTNATKYLKALIENKNVKCGIVAYTDQELATGICYFGKENLNRSLVIKGYSKNIAL